jgi:hypothetical protein
MGVWGKVFLTEYITNVEALREELSLTISKDKKKAMWLGYSMYVCDTYTSVCVSGEGEEKGKGKRRKRERERVKAHSNNSGKPLEGCKQISGMILIF